MYLSQYWDRGLEPYGNRSATSEAVSVSALGFTASFNLSNIFGLTQATNVAVYGAYSYGLGPMDLSVGADSINFNTPRFQNRRELFGGLRLRPICGVIVEGDEYAAVDHGGRTYSELRMTRVIALTPSVIVLPRVTFGGGNVYGGGWKRIFCQAGSKLVLRMTNRTWFEATADEEIPSTGVHDIHPLAKHDVVFTVGVIYVWKQVNER